MWLNSCYNEKCFRQNSQRKSKHALCVQKLFFRKSVLCEVMWENMVESERPQMT